jgi:hypothetical protein
MPYQDVLDHVGDFIRGRRIDMKLAARGKHLEASSWAVPTDRQMSVGAFGIGVDDFLVAKVEWRPSGADSSVIPNTAEVVAFERLDDLLAISRGSESFVAFYNDQDSIAFSEPQTTLINREYRIWYEAFDGFTTALTRAIGLPDAFITLGKYEVALRCLDQVETGTAEWQEKRERLRMSLLPFYQAEDERFKRWNTSQYGNKVTKKLGFRPRQRTGRMV